MTIGIGIIARNVERTLKPCVESFIAHVDQCVLVLAGESTDKTAKIAGSLRNKYLQKLSLHSFEWIDDFAAARNFSFSYLKTDWFMWIDADDVIYQPENIKKVVGTCQPDTGAIWLPYHYAMDEFQNLTTLYERERILRRDIGWVWKGRLHETVSPLQQCRFVRSDEVIIRHNHSAGENRNERNFRILNIMYKEDPEDRRIWLYMGHQHFAARNYNTSAEWYLKFGSDDKSLPIEKYQALCYASKALREIKNSQAIQAALMAIELYPNYKDGYLELAHSYYMAQEIDKALHWARISEIKQLIQEPPHIIFINPLDYTFNLQVLYSECHRVKGDLRSAIDYLAKAYEVRPVPEIGQNIQYLRQMEKRQATIDSVKVLAVSLLETREYTKLEALKGATPFWYRDLDDYLELSGGLSGYQKELTDKPEIAEVGDKRAIINIGNVLHPEETLKEVDSKYDEITVVCPLPFPGSKQIRTMSQRDMEELIMSAPDRHIINLQREETRVICHYNKKIPQNLAIRFYIGDGLEYWSLKTIKETRCGGSETAVARIAEGLAALDCQPIIYARDNQVCDGVIYRQWQTFRPDSPLCHLFISSRIPEILANDIPAKQKWLWFHDVHCWDRFTPEIAERIDAIVCLSKWHAGHLKRVYPFLKDAEVIDFDNNPLTYDDQWTGGVFYASETIRKVPKIAIIGNGLDIERFESLNETRIPHRFIWLSSPDRGLEEVLNMWGIIKEKLPDATLKIYYGWEYFDSSLWIPAQRELKERLLKLLEDNKGKGVEWCGRIGQNELAKELNRSDCLLYPPPHQFRETYGIAFLEAQAAGVLCFYRQNGALGETIGDRGIPLAMDMTPEAIATLIASTLTDDHARCEIRNKAREYALTRSWRAQAEKMLKLYNLLDTITLP